MNLPLLPYSRTLTILLLLLYATHTRAQISGVRDGYPNDSLIISFNSSNPYASDTNYFYIGRTAADSLWQIGGTTKTFFSSGLANHAIMTDTVQYYPANANSAFYIKTDSFPSTNLIVSFRHKYQTTTGKAGGIIEFSTDTGQTWHNVVGDCSQMGDIRLDSMYDYNDTLLTGTPAFTGNSNGWKYSRFQFFWGLPLLTTGTTFNCLVPYPMLRFRFVSDSSADTLDGWIIDSIKLEADYYFGDVAQTTENSSLHVYPNPSSDGLITFPPMLRSSGYTIEVFDMLGRQVINTPYTEKLNMSAYNKGVYTYRVSNKDKTYTGRIILE